MFLPCLSWQLTCPSSWFGTERRPAGCSAVNWYAITHQSPVHSFPAYTQVLSLKGPATSDNQPTTFSAYPTRCLLPKLHTLELAGGPTHGLHLACCLPAAAP